MDDEKKTGTGVSDSISRRGFLGKTAQGAAGLAVAGSLGGLVAPPALAASPRASKTSIVFQSGLTGGDGDAMLALVRQFMKQNPDISVKNEFVDWGTFFSKLFAALAAGKGPDVFIIHLQEMLEFQSKNALFQVDNWFGGKSGLPEKDFSPTALKYIKYQGHIWGVPLDLHGFGMYANPALLKKAGLPMTRPNSPEEFLHYAQKMTLDKHGRDATSKNFDPKNIVQWGTSTVWDSPPTFLMTLWQAGGNTVSADGKTATFNTPQVKQALSTWHDFIFKYNVCGKPSVVNSVTNNLYFANKLAMRPDGDWIRSFFIQNPKMGRLCWSMPRFNGNKDVAWASGHVLVSPNGLASSKQDAVRRFVTWLSNHDLQWSETAGHVPARVSAQKNPVLKSYWPQRVFAKELPEIGRIETPNQNIGQLETAFTQQVDGYWNGTVSLADAMSKGQSAMSRAMSGVG